MAFWKLEHPWPASSKDIGDHALPAAIYYPVRHCLQESQECDNHWRDDCAQIACCSKWWPKRNPAMTSRSSTVVTFKTKYSFLANFLSLMFVNWEGKNLWPYLSERLMLPMVEEPVGAKYHCEIVPLTTKLWRWTVTMNTQIRVKPAVKKPIRWDVCIILMTQTKYPLMNYSKF